MTNTLSNLYVEKASSEHPSALWMLNEELTYVSKIDNDNQRKINFFDFWDVDGAAASEKNSNEQGAPFVNSPTTEVSGDQFVGESSTISLTSKFFLDGKLENLFGGFAIGFFLNPQTLLPLSVSFGYQYLDTETNDTVEVLSTRTIFRSEIGTWKFVTDTFDLPPEDAEDIAILINIQVQGGGIAGDYKFLINGLSVGQWSEAFNKSSLGIFPEAMPANINLPSFLNVVPAFPYGASAKNAYYLSQGNFLSSINSGVPLVFGSSNLTKIFPNVKNNVTYPSLIFPGYGFLNDIGKNNSYTLEAWLRVSSTTNTPKRIFGPISGSDGIYADGAFLTLKIGDSYGSHYVGEWFRQMLLHIRLSAISVIVILNGEEVINLTIDLNSIQLPKESVSGKNQDWLGFYAYSDISLIEIDSFSIYPYLMPTEMTKRRWAWGQAVTAPEQTNSSINSITAFNDYSFANYAANYNYPDFANWNQGFVSNLNADKKVITFPDYQLPSFELGNQTVKSLYSKIKSENLDSLTLSPTADWGLDSDFIFFENLGLLTDSVKSVYGVFQTTGTELNKPLIKITKDNGDYFLINLNQTTVTYSVRISGVITTVSTKTIQANKKFCVGINIPNVSSLQIREINKFFANQSLLSLLVAGDGTRKFYGRIYKVGFDAAYNNRKIVDAYDNSGVFHSTEANGTKMFLHTANYTLTTISKYGIMFPDIAAAGYWEDYAPLSYFSKAITDFDESSQFELDSIQFNQDFPEPGKFDTLISTQAWTYQKLRDQYTEPTILSYSDLDNEFYTNWTSYEDMRLQAIRISYFLTEQEMLRSYVSFQKITNGANKTLQEFTSYAKPLASGIIDPATASDVDWESAAFEITSGTLIYPPKTTSSVNNTRKPISFNDYAMVYHLDFKSEGILHQPLRFRELQLASHVLERTDFTPVGSRFGIPVYYYTKNGIYYDLKAKNPIETYKKSTPYLYLNKKSGWKIKGEFTIETDRGLAVPINLPRASETEVSSIQMWVRYSEEEFPEDPIMVFSIEHNAGIYDFYIQGDQSLQRGRIFAVDRRSSQVIENIGYYFNGLPVYQPFLIRQEWAVIGLEFPDLLNFSRRTGLINLNGPLTYNNVSYNLATNIEKDLALETRAWTELMETSFIPITGVSVSGRNVTYTTSNNSYGYIARNYNFPAAPGTTESKIVGDFIKVVGATPGNYNVEGARVKSVGQNTITVEFPQGSTFPSPWTSGGTIITGRWQDLDDLPTIDGRGPVTTWERVQILSQSRRFSINPRSVYEKYTGSDRIVIDDESRGILVNPEIIRMYNEVSWSTYDATPV